MIPRISILSLLFILPFFAQDTQRNVEFEIIYNMQPLKEDAAVEFRALIPLSIEKRQEIYDINITPPPDTAIKTGYGSVGVWFLKNISEEQSISIRFKAALKQFDLHYADITNLTTEENACQDFLQAEKFLPVGDSLITGIIQGIPDGKDIHKVIKRLYHKTITSLSWADSTVPADLFSALQLRRGTHRHYADMFVTLCRSKGIPARVITGYIAALGTGSPLHSWVEVFTAEHGWIPFDPFLGDRKAVTFQQLKNIYVYAGYNRNEPELRGEHYFYAAPKEAVEVVQKVFWKDI